MSAQPKILPKPVDWDELYPGRFIKAGDFKGKNVTLTISFVKIEELVGDKGPQIKGVIGFEKTEKHWALNKTNGLCLKAMFGRKVQDWVGKRVTLFASMWDGEQCIRVFGSPELKQDMPVTIALPRKRPFEMTMHAGSGKSGVTSSAPSSDAIPHYDATSAISAMRECGDVEDLEKLYVDIKVDFRATNRDLPVDVEAAYHDRKEALSQ